MKTQFPHMEQGIFRFSKKQKSNHFTILLGFHLSCLHQYQWKFSQTKEKDSGMCIVYRRRRRSIFRCLVSFGLSFPYPHQRRDKNESITRTLVGPFPWFHSNASASRASSDAEMINLNLIPNTFTTELNWIRRLKFLPHPRKLTQLLNKVLFRLACQSIGF